MSLTSGACRRRARHACRRGAAETGTAIPRLQRLPMSVGGARRARTGRQSLLASADGARKQHQLPRKHGSRRPLRQCRWLRRAPQLNWSKCPAAECLRGEIGNIWAVRGTDAPLARVLQSVADGHPVAEITEYFNITPIQLAAVLQFAAEGAAPAGPAK